jgi:hypothetical protein
MIIPYDVFGGNLLSTWSTGLGDYKGYIKRMIALNLFKLYESIILFAG